MALSKYYLGELITQRREKNPGGDLPIRGVSKEGLQPPKQIDADTSIYNLYYRNDFVYNPARMELGSIAFNNEYDKAICSSLYEVFYVYRTDLVMPEYLAIFVKHPEFARYCNYIGNGSAREYCRFDNISGIPIYLPPISEQRKIVHDYQVITDRIELLGRMNHIMEEMLGVLYKKSIGDSSCLSVGPFSDVATVIMGQSPEGDDCNNDGIGEPLLNGPTEFGFYSPSPVQWTTNGNKHCQKGDLLFCVRGSTTGRMNWADQQYVIGRGLAAIRYKKDKTLNWLAKMMVSENLQSILAAATGTTFPNVGKDLLNGFQVGIPDKNWIDAFGNKGTVIMNNIAKNAMEMDRLLVLQSKIMSAAISKGA